jgi:hypothetical protein
MSRWQRVVDNLLTDLETAIPGADGFRGNIDHKIWEAEQTVSFAIPMTPYETTVRRLHGFQRELIERLSKQLKNDPANEILLEARSLLENPWLRVPEHQRADLRWTKPAGERSAANIAKRVIDFVALWVAPKSSLSDFTLVGISHVWPSARCFEYYICATAITASTLKSFLRRYSFCR